MRLAGFERKTQRFAGTQQMRLTYHVFQFMRTQPFRQRYSRLRLLEQITH
jgi:hypothetical protein